MSSIPLPLVQVIHENLATVMTFAFSKAALEDTLASHFAGGWKPLRVALLEIPQTRADRAAIELATFLRFLDDEEKLADYLRATKWPSFGRVLKQTTPIEQLYLRDLSNKVIHARQLVWEISNRDRPLLVCVSGDPARWIRAEIDLIALAGFCGALNG